MNCCNQCKRDEYECINKPCVRCVCSWKTNTTVFTVHCTCSYSDVSVDSERWRRPSICPTSSRRTTRTTRASGTGLFEPSLCLWCLCERCSCADVSVRLEMYCRDLTQSFSHVWIVSGPLLLPRTLENGSRTVCYQVRPTAAFPSNTV